MSEILKLLPEPYVFGTLKRPYDPDFHLALREATQQCLKFITGYARALVTDRSVLMVSSVNIPLKLISYATVYANKYWVGKGLIVFMAEILPILQSNSYDEHLESEQRRIQRLSQVSYEMYLEEHKFDVEGGLFPEYTFLPFDKTPEYYQRGIVLTK